MLEAILFVFIERVVLRVVRTEGSQTVIARLLGARATEWRERLAAFKRDRGSGLSAAWLIENAPLFIHAARFFREYEATDLRREKEAVSTAMLNRIRREGVTPHGCEFLVRHNNRPHDSIHEWLMAGFEERMRSKD